MRDLEIRGAVAPFTGAWIEMPEIMEAALRIYRVAPFTGAWIEIRSGR